MMTFLSKCTFIYIHTDIYTVSVVSGFSSKSLIQDGELVPKYPKSGTSWISPLPFLWSLMFLSVFICGAAESQPEGSDKPIF